MLTCATLRSVHLHAHSLPRNALHGTPPCVCAQAELVQQCSSQQLASLGLAPPPRPVVPKGLEKLALLQRLAAVQVGAVLHVEGHITDVIPPCT